jgi:hypothetical protein
MVRCWSLGLAAAMALAAAPRSAPAQPGVMPVASEEPRVAKPSYGGQIFAADGIVGALALGSGSGQVLLGLGLTGPVIHAAHGEFTSAFASLGLRVGAPVAGAYAGAAICNGQDDSDNSYDCMGSAMLGFAVGAAVALTIDYFVLAR